MDKHLDITEDSEVEAPIEADKQSADSGNTEISLEEKLAMAEEKLKEADAKFLRFAADSENRIKRIIREADDKIKYANHALLERFLPVMDSFELAVQHIEGVSAEEIAEGMRLNHKLLSDTLEKSGLSLIPIQRGDAFNPAVHEGIMLAKEESLPNDSIVIVVRNGYKMADRVIRPAQVQVNKL